MLPPAGTAKTEPGDNPNGPPAAREPFKGPAPGSRRPRLPAGSVARSMFVVGGASALGQGALVLASPVLSRLYDPEAFGLLSVYAALLSVLVAAASLRYDLAIPISADAVEAAHLLALSLILTVVSCVLLGIVIVGWGDQIATALGASGLIPYLWLLPVALLVASAAQMLASWAVYQRSFPALGRMRAMQGASQAVCQVVLGLAAIGPGGLIVGDIAGRTVGMEQLLRPLLATLRPIQLSFARVRFQARRQWHFARVMTLASLLNTLSLQIPFLLIPALFDLASSGQYFLAYRVLVLPASLVAAAVSQVFFGEASFRREDPRRFRDLAYNATVSLLVFAIPTYAIIAVAGQALIQVVFGPQWALAGLYAQILAPSLIFWSVASPISSLLLVGRREVESLAFTALELALKAAAFAIAAALGSLTVGIVVLSGVTILIDTAALWRFLRVPGVRLRELLRPAARILALTVPSLVLVVVVETMLPVGVVVACAVGWLAAFGLSLRASPEAKALLSGSHD